MTRPIESGVIFFARLLLAALFIWGAAMKQVGHVEFTAYLNGLGVPLASVATPLVIGVEGLGGLLLILGFRVRLIALLLAVYTLVSAGIGYNFWDVTDPQIQHDMVLHFWKNFAIAGGLLLLWVTGAGGFSVDGLRRPHATSFLKPRG
jgi:putative oxidoreductase